MKLLFTALIGALPIFKLKIFFLRALGHKIHHTAKIGFSLLFVDSITLKEKAIIGHFNFFKIKKLTMASSSFIKRSNIFKGPIDVYLDSNSGISKQNKFRRANYPISVGEASLHLGKNSFIVSNHFIDLTKSVSFGDNSILAGINTQLWTHGYYHANEGPDRIGIDGEIKIGNNVYVGSKCLFNPGVKVSDAIHIGAGSVISKDLTEKGMYVSQGLRFIKNDIDTIKGKLHKVEDKNLVEQVYNK